MQSWVFLLVGGLGAAGAAMTVGTLAALVQFRRTGVVPGTDDGDEAPPGTERRLWTRIVLGAVVAAVCATVLAERGLLAGPVLG